MPRRIAVRSLELLRFGQQLLKSCRNFLWRLRPISGLPFLFYQLADAGLAPGWGVECEDGKTGMSSFGYGATSRTTDKQIRSGYPLSILSPRPRTRV